VLGRMLESQNAQKLMNPASRQKIKQALEHLATNDPFQPVRDAANEALKRLR